MYNHGIGTSEVPTSVISPVNVPSAIPVVVGAAPIHMLADGSGKINEPILTMSYSEAVLQSGQSDDFDFTIIESIESLYKLFNVAPLIFINVFDPDVHKTEIISEEQAFVNDMITLNHPGLVSNPVVKNIGGETIYTLDTDYIIERRSGEIERLDSGNIGVTEDVKVTYFYGDPLKVTTTDIIGGVDPDTGKKTGWEVLADVFPKHQLVPTLLKCPKFSTDVTVMSVMKAKQYNINGVFQAIAIVDIEDTSIQKYQDVVEYKNMNNIDDPQMVCCWPKVKLGDREYYLSSQMAGVIARTDAKNSGLPYKSPSNENLQCNATVNNSVDVVLDKLNAQYLNGNGIVTALNFIGGWKAWGNRTSAYPANTDVKDSMIAVKRMFLYQRNQLILTYWQKVDDPTNKRLIDTIVDSENIKLNGWISMGALLAGKIEFREEENPVTDLLDGIVRFHILMTPPVPAREIDFAVEYDISGLSNLF